MAAELPDGLVAFVKRDCPTCVMVAPVLAALQGTVPLTVFTQDDPSFPPGVDAIDDTELEVSYRQGIEIVPTLLRVENGEVVDQLQGWLRGQWENLTGVAPLGVGLPEHRAGCGSRSIEPGLAERLAARYDGGRLASRRVTFGAEEDEFEAAYARGWSDGLPVVPPTPERVLRMLAGTSRGIRLKSDTLRALNQSRTGPARPGPVHGREGCRERGAGGLPPGVPARRPDRPRRSLHG